ncbi:P-loop containing nucleoside triphosphate hydrolase protein [Talaromyces proteolyticus]|uniref:ATP-dependent RNA helicase n=1 Tax=Talaromyces proteolyticus TaxID=1131652 RepID=A0AAD4KVG2_9EURO|nr:P-loop containing nucleoside triphosphate hydrolase protein [Talaromyces proteolyticus]KAH8699189.1 P-loop containing nucleoside triphosphate hydrolase protein [Talaromyces proteolyticus]
MAKKMKLASEEANVTKSLKSSSKKRHRDPEPSDVPLPSSPTSPAPKLKRRKREQNADSDVRKPRKYGAIEDKIRVPEVAGEGVSQAQARQKGAVSADDDHEDTESKRTKKKSSQKHRSPSPTTSVASTSDLRTKSKSTPDNNYDAVGTLFSTPKNEKLKRRNNKGSQVGGDDIKETSEITIDARRKHKHQHEERVEDDLATRHSKIMRKFEKSTKAKNPNGEKKDDKQNNKATLEEGTAVVAKGLEPLPQPQPVPEKHEKPTYSTMPNWITSPVTKSPYENKDGKPVGFGDLNLDRTVASKLEKHGYNEATEVQAVVIPLLIDKAYRHYGDLCVSASTGSGKTLSYVLPMDQSLERASLPRFRGLIVVPTRELVKQAREAFEVCGSNLRIGTAVGNVALKDEQQKLIRWDQVYNPEKFAENQKRMLAEDDWANFDLLKYKDEVELSKNSIPHYIQVPQPNVDVLITTPGRLVDHIRQTQGFSLRHLEWLVVDEADRLLNESFQEWVSVLMTELHKAKTVNLGGPVMDSMGHPLKSPDPKKVILSATLTNDITKLHSLRLNNPKLVAIGLKESGSEADEATHESEQFVLPSTLKEHYIPANDGSEKPIHLMRLLLQEINKTVWGPLATDAYKLEKIEKHAVHEAEDSDANSDSDDTSSDDDSSESDSDSDSNSTSGSNSTSDSSSDNETDDTSGSESDADSDVGSQSDQASVQESVAKPAAKNDGTSVLIFTKSTESAARLSLLLGLMNPSLKSKIGTIVKSNNSSSSRKTLKNYRAGKVKIIVATDRASRGIDLVDLGAVINYDIPTSITTYVHRVGRTARAGKSGHAWSLVEHREGLWFQKTIVRSEKVVRAGKIVKQTKSIKNTKAMKTEFANALEQLEKAVKG